jgi:hypothetical protein
MGRRLLNSTGIYVSVRAEYDGSVEGLCRGA